MTFISVLLRDLERSSPGSAGTAKQVLSMLGGIAPKSALFVGDEITTPQLISGQFGCRLTSAFTDEFRAEQCRAVGLDASVVQLFELPGSDGGYDLVWYNGIVEFDGCAQRLEQLRAKLAKGGTLVLVLAKEHGWRVQDFYIAPKSDWHAGYYTPLIAAAEKYAGIHKDDSSVSLGMSELRKECGIFDAHCEEYSCVYYILKG